MKSEWPGDVDSSGHRLKQALMAWSKSTFKVESIKDMMRLTEQFEEKKIAQSSLDQVSFEIQ